MRGKLSAILLILFLFGVPALVVGALLFTSVGSATVCAGNQPGGIIRGTIVDGEGRPVKNIKVRLVAAVRGADNVEFDSASSADGSFEFDSPPIDGHYELHVGGGVWQFEHTSISFLDDDGEPLEVSPFEFVVKPACLIEIELVDADGTSKGGGEYDLAGKFSSGLLFGLHNLGLSSSGTFQDGSLKLDGLPELEGALNIQLDSGETVQIQLELKPGLFKQRVEL